MKKPHPKKKNSGPLLVHSDLWAGKRCYIDREGERIDITRYEEAREYAARHGFNGIRVKYCNIS